MIKEIRQEIFRLAKASKDLETMHWYIALDNCFENDELQEDEIENLKWRATVLSMKQEPITRLLWMIDYVIRPYLD